MNRRRGFTLVELLITVSIIGIMASMVLFAMFGATESARKRKTEALVARLNAIVQAKWESYETRRIPVMFPAATIPQLAAKMRLDCLRDLMRMEMPDRWSDVEDDPATPFEFTSPTPKIARPAPSQGYLRQLTAARNKTPPPSPSDIGLNSGAECLYMIVKGCVDEDGDGSDVFKPDSIGDTDGDGLLEFVDAWGTPIKFLRWAPGFFLDSSSGAAPECCIQVRGQVMTFSRGNAGSPPITPATPTTMTVRNLGGMSTSHFSQIPGSYAGSRLIVLKPDGRTYDLTKTTKIEQYAWNMTDVTLTWAFSPTNPPDMVAGDKFAILKADSSDYRGVYPNAISFAMTPLIFSAGPNKCFGICADFDAVTPLRYTTVGLDPFHIGTDAVDGVQRQIGSPRDEPLEKNHSKIGWTDNIHNQSFLGR